MTTVVPLLERFSGTKRGLVVALGLLNSQDLPDGHVHVHDAGGCVTLDYSGNLHAERDVRYVAAVLGLVVRESPTETADGCAATEYRAQNSEDGVLLTVRAAVPMRALWPVTR